jgi:RNA polymerase sigma-70 factor, ECF subfamily
LDPGPENQAALEESQLLARMGVGDREAFRELYSRYSRPLYSFAVRLVGDAGEAEERLQDAFVKIWQNASTYDPRKSRPFTWAVTITRRTCIDGLRRRRLKLTTTPLADEGTAAVVAPDPGAGELAEAREDSERLRGALADIPAGQRTALELALFSALTHFEIARQLDQPVGTVKSWIRRGLLGLRSTLADPSP